MSDHGMVPVTTTIQTLFVPDNSVADPLSAMSFAVTSVQNSASQPLCAAAMPALSLSEPLGQEYLLSQPEFDGSYSAESSTMPALSVEFAAMQADSDNDDDFGLMPSTASTSSGRKAHLTSNTLKEIIEGIADKFKPRYKWGLSKKTDGTDKTEGLSEKDKIKKLYNNYAYHYVEKDCTGCDFSDGNFSSFFFYRTILKKANFTGAKLDGAHFSYAEMQETIFTNTDLREALMRSAEIDRCNFSGCIISHNTLRLADIVDNNTIVLCRDGKKPNEYQTGLLIPKRWTPAKLERYLNHFTNDGHSLAVEIDSLDDKNNETKIRLACGLMASLQGVNISAIAFQILTVLYKSPYLHWRPLKHNLDNMLVNVMNCYRDAILPSRRDIVQLALVFFRQDNTRMVTHNALFIQAIERTLTCVDCHDYSRLAGPLYDKYLQQPQVAPYLAEADAGNVEYPPQWQDDDALNFILLGNLPPGSKKVPPALPAIFCSLNTLTDMLKASNSECWEHIFTLEKPGVYISPQEWRESPVMKERFPLLYKLFEGRKPAENLYKLQMSIFNRQPKLENAGKYTREKLLEMFHDATKVSCKPEPLTELHEQHFLMEIFSPLLTDSLTLSRQHYQEILQIYDMTQASAVEKGEVMWGLAMVCINLSSSRFLGREEISPQWVRQLANAYMELGHQLSPETSRQYGLDLFSGWQGSLMGGKGQFTCTALLFDEMAQHMSEHAPGCLRYIPPAWGGDACRGDLHRARRVEKSSIKLAPTPYVGLAFFPQLQWLRDHIDNKTAWAHPSFEAVLTLIALCHHFRVYEFLLVVTNQQHTIFQVIDSITGEAMDPEEALESGRLLAVMQFANESHYNAWSAPGRNVRFVAEKGLFTVDTSPTSGNQFHAIPASGFCMTEAAATAWHWRITPDAVLNTRRAGRALRKEIAEVLKHAERPLLLRLNALIPRHGGE